jgi:predicted transcriptional regulator
MTEMREIDVKTLSPTAKTLYWFRRYKRSQDVREMRMKDASEESGIPLSTLYRAARELEMSIDRGGSVLTL